MVAKDAGIEGTMVDGSSGETFSVVVAVKGREGVAPALVAGREKAVVFMCVLYGKRNIGHSNTSMKQNLLWGPLPEFTPQFILIVAHQGIWLPLQE